MPLEEERELSLSFDFFYNFVSFLKLQTLQGFKMICAWSSARWVRQCRDPEDVPARPLLSELAGDAHLLEFDSLFF